MTAGQPDLRATSAYDYALPPDRIARYPAARRDDSRLLVLPRLGGGDGLASDETSEITFRDLRFAELTSLLAEGDLLVLNESRVIPARLLGRKPTGAECEILLLRPMEEPAGARWEALVRPGAKLKLDKFVYNADATNQEVAVSFLKGAFRFITGKSKKEAYKLKTSNASIGVRGTVFDAFIADDLGTLILLHEGALGRVVRLAPFDLHAGLDAGVVDQPARSGQPRLVVGQQLRTGHAGGEHHRHAQAGGRHRVQRSNAGAKPAAPGARDMQTGAAVLPGVQVDQDAPDRIHEVAVLSVALQ